MSDRAKRLAEYLENTLGWDVFPAETAVCNQCMVRDLGPFCPECGAPLEKFSRGIEETLEELEDALKFTLDADGPEEPEEALGATARALGETNKPLGETCEGCVHHKLVELSRDQNWHGCYAQPGAWHYRSHQLPGEYPKSCMCWQGEY